MSISDTQPLSTLDAGFLHCESPEMPMHVASVHLLELPAGYDGDFFQDVKAHMASRLHLAPIFTRKLALMPFDLANPVWVEDEDVDLEHHVRHIVLPRPGTWQQLERVVGRLHSQLLDRSRPLWEMTVIEGLQTGHPVLYAKAHHAGLDGQSGVIMASSIFDTEPSGRVIKSPRPRLRSNRYQLGVAELAGAALSNTARQYMGLVKSMPGLARAFQKLLVPERDADGKRRWLSEGAWLAPRTPFNVSVTNQRSWAARSVSLAVAKAIGKAHGATVNDVALTLVSGAMRRYLKDYDALPAKSMIAAVPVSLREEGDDSATNQVSMVTMTLASNVKDPLERLKVIASASKRTKTAMMSAVSALPMDIPMLGAPWLVSGLASLYGRSRLADNLPQPVNVVVSNVPSAKVPLYFAGARMRNYYPCSIPSHGVALNATLHSYNGQLEFGLIACRRAVPDVADLADHLLAEYRLLCERAGAVGGPALVEGASQSDPQAAQAAVRPHADRRTKKEAPARTVAARRMRAV